jgi:hypothetical protein
VQVCSSFVYAYISNLFNILISFRALGLLYIFLMRPFEDLLCKGSIWQLNGDILLLHETLSDWAKDRSLPLKRTDPVFADAPSYLCTELGRFAVLYINLCTLRSSSSSFQLYKASSWWHWPGVVHSSCCWAHVSRTSHSCGAASCIPAA